MGTWLQNVGGSRDFGGSGGNGAKGGSGMVIIRYLTSGFTGGAGYSFFM